MLLVGPSCSGKSTWLNRLLKEKDGLYENSTGCEWKILFCYNIYGALYDEMERCTEGITFKQGLPTKDDIDELEAWGGPKLLILDDLSDAGLDSAEIDAMFTQGVHHRDISIVVVVHNLFSKRKFARNIALNSFYVVLFDNARDPSQISTLARQIFPGQTDYMLQAYKDAMKRPHSYLFVDVSPRSDAKYRLRTDVFPSDEYPVIYQSA
jgi:hypothetical protein